MAGGILLAWSLAATVAVLRYPGANAFDHWGFSVFEPSPQSELFSLITDLGGVGALAVGSLLAAAMVVSRDRWRAAVCLCGPAATTALVEWVIKPLVGRRYIGVLTFPSGSVTVIASLAVAWALAVPRWLRWWTAALGVLLVAAMAVAVVALRWHYPSDALAGATFGAGAVLTLDGIVHLPRLA